MSFQAVSWALDESESVGTDRLVVIIMCHHAEEGFCWASRSLLTDETKLSGSTVARCQERIARLGEIRECSPKEAPALYLALPINRRPRLWELTGFLGSHYADSVRRRASKSGSSQGARRVRVGSQPTPSDQDLRDAKQGIENMNEGVASLFDLPTAQPPWLREGITREEWVERGRATG